VDVIVRERRQITLPAEVCVKLGLEMGDRLEVFVKDDTLVVRPKKTLAIQALREIQTTFSSSGVSEKELLEAGRKIREKIYKERYGKKTTRLP